MYYLFDSEESKQPISRSVSIAELKVWARRNCDSFVIRHGAGLHTENNAHLQPIVYSFTRPTVPSNTYRED